MSNNLINNIDLVNGLNINPIPLEVTQAMTTTKFLYSLQAKVNEVVNASNNALINANNYTDSEALKLLNQINGLIESLNSGEIIPNGSIGLEKINQKFLNDVYNMVSDSVKNIEKFVWFGLDNNGYFIANVPTSWQQVIFSTSVDGNLTLELKEVY